MRGAGGEKRETVCLCLSVCVCVCVCARALMSQIWAYIATDNDTGLSFIHHLLKFLISLMFWPDGITNSQILTCCWWSSEILRTNSSCCETSTTLALLSTSLLDSFSQTMLSSSSFVSYFVFSLLTWFYLKNAGHVILHSWDCYCEYAALFSFHTIDVFACPGALKRPGVYFDRGFLPRCECCLVFSLMSFELHS